MQEKLKIRIKKLSKDSVLPTYSKPGDAGLDLVATSALVYNDYIEYGTGLAIEIPKGYVGLIFPRSSIYKTSTILSNSVGVIDSGYRGEIKFKFYAKTVRDCNGTLYSIDDCYEVGNRIGQLIIMPYPQIEFEEAEKLSETERNTGGFGSTGK